MKTKLTGVRVPIGKPSSTALSLFRSSARLASFSAKDLKAGVARIAEQSKSQEASGSDKTLDILIFDVQPPQDPPRVMSPEIVQAQKRKREDVILEEEEGEKQPIPAQPLRSIRQVPARIDDMDDARARIDEFSAKMSDQLLSASTLESSTRVVSILTSLVTRAAELASQAREGLDAGLATACQLRDAQARVSSLEEKLDKVNRDLHTSRGNEVVLQSQLGTARESTRAAIVCEVAAKNAEKVVSRSWKARSEAMQDRLRKNEELVLLKRSWLHLADGMSTSAGITASHP
ncbi:uncharacterized protein LOC141641655 [Silene latifolia]|uniref:uncharacterized protein LOC141641655 n=1 Tax=Silene latifolia TaxID=37657 RepID=UPI003D7846F6